jgi:hypothetical protein
MPGPRDIHFDIHRALHRDLHLALAAHLRRKLPKGPKRKPRKGKGGELMPVEPDRPKGLEGGAAAALEFDD